MVALMHLNTTKAFSWVKWLFVCILLMGLLWWLLHILFSEILKNPTKTLYFLSGVDAAKPYFLMMRLAIYASTYVAWNPLLKKLKPNISSDHIAQSKKIVVRFFIVYELLFGIQVLDFITH
jgi:hypothetical protein